MSEKEAMKAWVTMLDAPALLGAGYVGIMGLNASTLSLLVTGAHGWFASMFASGAQVGIVAVVAGILALPVASAGDVIELELAGETLREPRLVVDDGGRVTLIAAEWGYKEKVGSTAALVHTGSFDGGQSWTPFTTIVDTSRVLRSSHSELYPVGSTIEGVWVGRRATCVEDAILFGRFDHTGRLTTGPTLLGAGCVGTTGPNARTPSLLAMGTRRLCTYLEEDSVRVVRSFDEGCSWSPPRAVPVRRPLPERNDTLSNVAGDPTGRYVAFAALEREPSAVVLYVSEDFGLTWRHETIWTYDYFLSGLWLTFVSEREVVCVVGRRSLPSDGPSNTWSLHLRIEPDGVREASDPVQISEAGVRMSFPRGHRSPRDGSLHVGMRYPLLDCNDIYYTRSRGAGQPWSAPVRVNANPCQVHPLGEMTFDVAAYDYDHAWLAWNEGGVFGRTIGVTTSAFDAQDITHYETPRPVRNPLASTGSVAFLLNTPASVTLAMFDVRGRLMGRLAAQAFSAGLHEVALGSLAEGRRVPSGVYFVRVMRDGAHGERTDVMRAVVLQ